MVWNMVLVNWFLLLFLQAYCRCRPTTYSHHGGLRMKAGAAVLAPGRDIVTGEVDEEEAAGESGEGAYWA